MGIDKQYLSRLEASFFLDGLRLEADDTSLACHHHHVIFRNEVACRTQAVTVQHTSGIPSVAEKQGGRSVPRFHQDGMVFVECLQVFADRILVVERFGHQHRHGMRQAQARHHEKLQYIVQRGAIAHARLDDGTDILYIAQSRRRKHTFPGFHPCTVSPDGIDFTVMRQEAERLGKAPRGEGVGAEAGMHDGKPAGEVRLCQVLEILAYLHRREHTFINNVLAGQ